MQIMPKNILLFWQASKSILRGNILSYSAHRDKTFSAAYIEQQSALTSAYLKCKDAPTPAKKEFYLSQKSTFDAMLSQAESKYPFSLRFHRYGNPSGKLLSNLLWGQWPPTNIKSQLIGLQKQTFKKITSPQISS